MASAAVEADYVVVFEVPNSSSPDAKLLSQHVQDEYQRALNALRKSGLHASGRPGHLGSSQILILVRAPRQRLELEVERERISDALSGVGSLQAMSEQRDYSKNPLSSSERLRNVYRIITFDETGQYSLSDRDPSEYARIIPKSANYPHVSAIFPPHDPEFNSAWMHRWSSFSSMLSIPEDELVALRNHFGSTIALYFEFLRFYFISLMLPAVLGTAYWFMDGTFTPTYSVAIVLWSILFVEGWRLREKRVSIKWNTSSVTAIGRSRAHFMPESLTYDSVLQHQVGHFPWWKRELRIVTSLPALLGFASILALIITTLFFLEVIITEAYAGPGKEYLPLLPTILFAGLVPQVISLWQKNAEWLTTWENYESDDSHEFSMTIKMFIMNCMVAYGALTLTAYIYLPFGCFIVPRVISHLKLSSFAQDLASGFEKESFTADPNRLVNTLFAFMTTTQVVNAFTENLLPIITRWLTNKAHQVRESKNGTNTPKDEDDEKEYLDRIRREAQLAEYSLFTEYGEMVVQFGYIVLWSVVWPLAPLMAFINNFFELRSDAFKLSVNARRPVPIRRDTIGPWLDAMGAITWLGALINPSLIYLFRPYHLRNQGSATLTQSASETIIAATKMNTTENNMLHSALDISLGSTSQPYQAVESLLFSSLLVALASEHGYFLARAAIRHLLKRALWIGSKEEIQSKKERMDMKRSILANVVTSSIKKDFGGINDENADTSHLGLCADKKFQEVENNILSSPFWSRPDRGAEELARLAKVD